MKFKVKSKEDQMRERIKVLESRAEDLACCLSNLVGRGLIKDPDGDHYTECLKVLGIKRPSYRRSGRL